MNGSGSTARAASQRADRLRQARAQAMAKRQQGSKQASQPSAESKADSPDGAARDLDLARKQAEADEMMRELLAEEASAQKKRSGKRDKGKGTSASARPHQLSAKRQVKISKAMSYLLRHGAADAGLKMRPDGFVELTALLAHERMRGCTVDEVAAVVSSNDKQRFRLYTDPATDIQWIRANQGHTLSTVLDTELLVEIVDPTDAPVCVHGTYYTVLPLILQNGLSRMARNHVHFAPGLPSKRQGGVISGMRGNCDVAIYLNVSAALQAGIKLYRSDNGVLLSPGDASGSIQPSLFEKVVDLQTGENLPFQQGQENAGFSNSVGAEPVASEARMRSSQKPDQARLSARRPTTEGGKKISSVRLNEVVGDLFAYNYGASDGICHCVSEDMHMGKGIATQFKTRYGRVTDLLAQKTKTGGCAQIRVHDRYWVYYLVTKVKYSDKPTYDSLRRSLVAMKTHMLAHDVKRLSLPKIGCGLDRLKWVADGGKLGVKTLLLDVFAGTDIVLTVYELGNPQHSLQTPSKRVSEHEAHMQIYSEHRARLQAQGMAAEAHRSLQQVGEPKGKGCAGTGRAGRRAQRKTRRQELRDESLLCRELAPVAVGSGHRDDLESYAGGLSKQCEQCKAFATSGELDVTVNQWFCDACWDKYKAEDVGGHRAESTKASPHMPAEDGARVDQLAAKRSAALHKLCDHRFTSGRQIDPVDKRKSTKAWSTNDNSAAAESQAATDIALAFDNRMTAARLKEKWLAVDAKSVEVLPFYSERGQYGVFSNFAPAPFSFDLPISLVFGEPASNRPHGFRSPVPVQWSEQAIMLCKAAAFRDIRAYQAIVAAASPMEAKRCGRAVRNFDEARWRGLVCEVAKEVVLQKFTKVDGLAAKLRATGTKVLAEASESDAIWGIGMRCDDPCCATPSKWRGTNILGWALMEARDQIGAHLESANEVARRAAMVKEDERLQSNSKSQVHVDKAPPKHSLAAMANMGSRRERQQDNVMAQMQDRAAEAGATASDPEAKYQEIHTCHLYGVDEIMSAFQKTMRRNQVDDAMWWAMELEMSDLGRMAMSRLTVITVEDVGTGAPLLPVYIAAAWRCYMDLQDPQSTKFNAQAAKAKLMEAAYTVSVVRGNHMTCSAKHAGTLALKAELLAVGDSAEAAAEIAGDGSKGLAERAGGLVASTKAAIEMAREATLPEQCTAMELKALGRLQALACRAPSNYSAMTWTMLRKFPTTYKCTHQSVEALYAMCHGGGCSTADLCVYNALLLISRETWLSFPPHALNGIKVADPTKVTPEVCGCGPPGDLPTASVDFDSVAKMLSELPRGIGGRHPNGLPWYVVDGHTRRGSGMDTTGLFHEAAQRWNLSSEIAEWPAAEIAVSHGPGRHRGPVDENGHGGSWLRSPDGISFPSNVERSFGDDDGSEDDPFASAEIILEGIWGVTGVDMPDDAMAANLASLGKARSPAPAPFLLQDHSAAAFPTLEDATSGATPVQKAGFGAGNMWDDSVRQAAEGSKVATRKGKGGKKRRSRVQGSGWADQR